MEDSNTTDRIELGDFVIFQGFIMPPEAEDFMPTIPITIEKVEGFSEDGSMIKLQGHDALQPKYRVKTVIRDGKRRPYVGYSYVAIARDEGQISDETFNDILEVQAMSDVI